MMAAQTKIHAYFVRLWVSLSSKCHKHLGLVAMELQGAVGAHSIHVCSVRTARPCPATWCSSHKFRMKWLKPPRHWVQMPSWMPRMHTHAGDSECGSLQVELEAVTCLCPSKGPHKPSPNIKWQNRNLLIAHKTAIKSILRGRNFWITF